MKPLSIALLSGISANNLGDDASLVSVVRDLQELLPSAKIVVLAESPEMCEPVAEQIGVPILRSLQLFVQEFLRSLKPNQAPAVEVRKLGEHLLRLRDDILSNANIPGVPPEYLPGLRFLMDADGAIQCGGANVTPLWKSYFYQKCLEFILAPKELFIFSQGVDPFEENTDVELLRYALSRASEITVREGISERYLRSIGCVAPLSTTGDDTITLTPSSTERTEALLAGAGIGDRRGFLAFQFRRYLTYEEERFLELFAQYVDQAAEETGLSVVGVPMHFSHTDERDHLHLIRKRVEKRDRFHIIESQLKPADAKAVFARARAAFGISYHSAIFALSSGTPFLGLYHGEHYAQKMKGLSELYGFPDLARPATETPPGNLGKALAALCDRRESISAHLNLRTCELAKQVRSSRRRFVDRIESEQTTSLKAIASNQASNLRIFGLMIVRNEEDILRVNIRHHLDQGIDRFLVVDNGSTDRTTDILEELSGHYPVEWRRDPGPYRQSEITTELAREACCQGADWVIAIDADEFWYAPEGNLRGVLEASSAGALQVDVLNYVQRRALQMTTPEGLLCMEWRTALPVGPLERVRELVESRQFGYVEMMYSPKFVSRCAADIRIAMGNHGVAGVSGPIESTDQILCLHAVLRARSILEAKVEQGERVEALGLPPEQGWHVQRWRRIAQSGDLDGEWLANSCADGALDVYGKLHPLVFDPTLRDLIAKWIPRHPETAEQRDREHALLRWSIGQEVTSYLREQRRWSESFRSEISKRDQVIHELQAELQAKIGERDRMITGLQAKVREQADLIAGLQVELHEKIGEANRIIEALHEELEAKVGERDRMITDLQVNVREQAQIIGDLQTELHQKIHEANRIIEALQQELRAKVGERDGTIRELQAELHAKVGQRDQTIVSLQDQLKQRDKLIADLHEELESIRRSKVWAFVEFLRGNKAAKARQRG